MTKDDDGRLEHFGKINLDFSSWFLLEIETIIRTDLEFVSAFQDSLFQRAVFQCQYNCVPLPRVAGLLPDKRSFNAFVAFLFDGTIVVGNLHTTGNRYTN